MCASSQGQGANVSWVFLGKASYQHVMRFAHRTGWLSIAARSHLFASPHIVLSRRIKLSTLDRNYFPVWVRCTPRKVKKKKVRGSQSYVRYQSVYAGLLFSLSLHIARCESSISDIRQIIISRVPAEKPLVVKENHMVNNGGLHVSNTNSSSHFVL